MQLTTRHPSVFSLESHQPLYARAPSRDENGQPFGDFMVLLPGLRDRPQPEFLEVVAQLQAVIAAFSEIVFVDLNVRLNLLWVSVRPRPGVILELFQAMRQRLPEARLVGQQRE